jgi:hypothetical protein
MYDRYPPYNMHCEGVYAWLQVIVLYKRRPFALALQSYSITTYSRIVSKFGTGNWVFRCKDHLIPTPRTVQNDAIT